MRSTVFAGLFLLATQPALAQTSTVEVTIESVKPEAKEVTVTYKTNLGEKSITLDVSRKAAITLNDAEATLESLGPGLKATVEFNRELEIVTEIAATGKSLAAPEWVDVSELDRPFSACLSEDGLTIYYERRERGGEEPPIYTAHRKDADSFFEHEERLFTGYFPTVTNDGLEMILLKSPAPNTLCLFSTTRDSISESFRRPRPVAELRDPPEAASYAKNPCLSPNGLALYFNRYPEKGKNEIAFATRPDRRSPWSKPQTLKLNGATLLRDLTCPFVTADGSTLFCVMETPEIWTNGRGNLLKFTRATPYGTFGSPEFVGINGLPPFTGRYPRFVSATKELFFYQAKDRYPDSHLIAIKNFSLDFNVGIPQSPQAIEACIANDRRADNGSPDLRARSLDRPRIENADINRTTVKDDWINLFDGHSLRGWKPDRNPQIWSVSQGAIVGRGRPNMSSHLFYETAFADFEFEGEVKINRTGNSGLYFRAEQGQGNEYPEGYEVQIAGTSSPRHITASLFKIADADRNRIRDDTWFQLRLTAKKDRITVAINGQKVVEHRDSVKRTGRIAIQCMPPDTEVHFRNLRVRPLQ